jgi:Ca-activated chloride channel family protein
MRAFAIAAAALILYFGHGFAISEAQNAGEGLKFSVQSQLVEIFLTVTDGKQLVPNLTASDFTIDEDGVPVPVDRLDNPAVPLQIVLLVDLSESIRPSLKTIQDAAVAFLESLNTRDRVMLVLFNSELRFSEQKTEDRGPIIREIRNARASGMTKLYEALLSGMQYLQGKEGRKAIVCFTDGQDTSGTSSANIVMNSAARAGYPIYMIGAGAGLELDSLKILLRGFAEVNSGRAFFIHSVSKLRDAFNEVAAELRSAYVLNYYTQVPADGRWHGIVVSTNNPAYVVHARKGFYARRE